jgi:hypothetical protein
MLTAGLLVLLLVFMVGCLSDQPEMPQVEQSMFGDEVGLNVDRAFEGTPRMAPSNGGIEEIDPSTLTCDGIIQFDDITGGIQPGTHYDTVVESDGADFAERFVGQTLTLSGNFDILSGTPSGPLSLQVGAANHNVGVVEAPSCGPTQILAGWGPPGFPDFSGGGEGCFAVLFDFDQSEFGFRICGGNGGTAAVNFFQRNGSLIDQIVVANLSDQVYAFRRLGGVNDIAGISIHNDDPGGVGFDDLCHDVPGVPGDPNQFALDIHPTSCPNPLNVKSKGLTPVAILGSTSGDVLDIDVSTVLLEGVAPIRSSVGDVATPLFDGEECECTTDGPDGIMDLTLKFLTQDLVAAIGSVEDGEVLMLALTATLLDGTPIEFSDCVIMRVKLSPHEL